ncbi:MAG: ATP-binding cassette domain-containing protein, partial [Actinomycetota bacterium]
MTAVETTAAEPTTGAPLVSLRNVTKRYTDSSGVTTEVLAGVDLDVAEGKFVAVLGFSGSGKTTLISSIAGLIDLDDGEITVDGAPISGPDTDRGVVFQSYSLPPWLTVEENVALAVNAIHTAMTKAERRHLIDETIELVGLSHARDRR